MTSLSPQTPTQSYLLDWLSCISIVMIGTTLPANIGSAARALHTMGLSDLVVINPRLPIDETSYANAAGGKSILQNARVINNIEDAISDCTLVFAASARSRQMPRPVVTPNLAAQISLQHFDAIKKVIDRSSPTNHSIEHLPKVAILFGREDRGLTNEELALAHYHIQIPANPDYPVLNIASAIQVIAAYFYEAITTNLATNTPVMNTKQLQGIQPITHTLNVIIRSDWDEGAITHQQTQTLNTAIITLMKKLNLTNDNNLKHLPNRISRLSNRLQLDQKEYALLQALIAKIGRSIKD